MIASDGFIENGRGHPRTSGTFAKVLGKIRAQDKGAVPLMDALRRMTLEPARRLERRTPAMAHEGPHQGRRRRRPDDFRSGDRHRSGDLRRRHHPVGGDPVRHRRRPGGGGRRPGDRGAAGPRHPRADSLAASRSCYFDERASATSTGVARYSSGNNRFRSSIFGRSLMAM